MEFDEDSEEQSIPEPVLKRKTQFVDLSRKQAPFMALIAKFHDLFWELPDITTREVDKRLQPMFEDLLNASAEVGISRMSVPQLKECCGKKRVWKDPGASSAKGAFKLGDFLKKIFSLLGFKPCPGCERRRAFLNRIRWPK